jgi:hypothetical protein
MSQKNEDLTNFEISEDIENQETSKFGRKKRPTKKSLWDGKDEVEQFRSNKWKSSEL